MAFLQMLDCLLWCPYVPPKVENARFIIRVGYTHYSGNCSVPCSSHPPISDDGGYLDDCGLSMIRSKMHRRHVMIGKCSQIRFSFNEHLDETVSVSFYGSDTTCTTESLPLTAATCNGVKLFSSTASIFASLANSNYSRDISIKRRQLAHAPWRLRGYRTRLLHAVPFCQRHRQI